MCAQWSENAKKVLTARYLIRDKKGEVIEVPDDMLVRVATYISSNEKDKKYWKNKFLEIMDSLEFLPNSPCLINAGRELSQLSACFVLPIGDSIEDIFEMVKQSAVIHRSGGGTGFNFSSLRPNGALVSSTQGVASGPVSFMHAFDIVTDIVRQGGVRRGANIGILNYSHPDIIEFIDCKKDKKNFNNFNISVALNDRFFNFIKNGDYIQLHYRGFPYKEKIKAQDILDKICENSWDSGEPGVLFLDIINKHNPIPQLGYIFATNPCIAGDTLIAVADGRGAVSIKQLADENKDIPIYCSDPEGWKHIRWGRNPRKTGVKQPVYKIVLDDGSYIKATSNHEFYLKDGTRRKVSELSINDSLMRFDKYQFSYGNKSIKYWGIQRARGNVYQEHRLISEFNLGRRLLKGEKVHHCDFNGLNNSQENLIPTFEHKKKFHDISGNNNPMRRFPEKNIFNNPEWQKQNIIKHHLGKKRSSEVCNNVSKGVKRAFRERPEYGAKISEIMKKLWKDPNYREHQILAMRKNHKISSIKFCGYEDVYNITVDEFHNYCVITSIGETKQSGIIISNCGEAPLLPFESCNLGSINLSKFVSSDKKINFERLEEVVKIAVRFLDNMIDVNKYPRIQIARKSRYTRKIGLGIMGWADMLALLNIQYDTEEALKLAEKIMSLISKTSHKESYKLGIEKGVNIRSVKRRNVCTTTIAPTGSLSIIAGCSSGIEPYFAKTYTKEVLNGTKLELGALSEIVKTATEITPEWHIRTQAIFQRYTDQAVSKTINLPFEATKEDIKKSILLAHSLECKGLTFYRQGSREIAPLKELSECNDERCLI